MSEKSGFGSKLDKSAVNKVLDFLFGRPEDTEIKQTKKSKDAKQEQQQPNQNSKRYMDMRTDITNKETFQALTYYRLLEEQYDCKAAGRVADILECLAISNKRMGRLEGVAILKQQLPKEEVLLKGMSDSLREMGEHE